MVLNHFLSSNGVLYFYQNFKSVSELLKVHNSILVHVLCTSSDHAYIFVQNFMKKSKRFQS